MVEVDMSGYEEAMDDAKDPKELADALVNYTRHHEYVRFLTEIDMFLQDKTLLDKIGVLGPDGHAGAAAVLSYLKEKVEGWDTWNHG